MTKPLPDQQRHLEIGLAHHRAGRLDAAAAVYRKVLEHSPNQPDALNLLGVIAQDRGQPVRAVELISKALRRRSRFPEALTNLARAQRAAGDPESAADSARRAIALAPDLAEAHVQLGRALLDLEDYAASAEACRAAIALAPTALDPHVNLAAALTLLKDHFAAAQAYQVAHELNPDRAETLTDFAAALTELERHDDALACHERAVALAPNDPRTHAGHAVTLKRAQHVAASIEACRRALALSEDLVKTWLLLGANLASLGRFKDAVVCYRRANELDPDSAEVQRAIVAAGEPIEDSAEVARLAAVLDNSTVRRRRRISAGFALGSMLDKGGEYDAAFAAIAAANSLVREQNEEDSEGFDLGVLRREVNSQIAAFTAETFAAARGWGDPSDAPVFIVGMPRSGTTLAEQIACSHPDVFGGGERKDVGRAVRMLVENASDIPTEWDPAMVRQQSTAYLARMQALAGGASRVVDKMPDNIIWLGAIAVLFPNARIVLCRRDLRDVCLSCFFQSFSEGLPWSNNLADCANRALEIEQLVTHWRAVLPLPLMELQYETLVADLEGESRRLIEFIGLPWDPACLAFHKTERQVMTASLWQVRQPLYSSSVGRWRHYRRHLAPLFERLTGVVPADDFD